MNILKTRVWLGSILLLCLLVQTTGVQAQCGIFATNMDTYTTGGMEVRYQTKTLSNSYSCSLAMSYMAKDCSGSTGSTMYLIAQAFETVVAMAGTQAICSWNCPCGTVKTTATDLPVELMEFEVDP